MKSKGWESVEGSDTIFRLSVPGGWLVKYCVLGGFDGEQISCSITFYPDPKHSWKTPIYH
jgi:hypothetical protein